MDGVFIALAIIIAYLLGSIPSAYLIGRLRKGTDIREMGTRNMGAMNVVYTVGFWWGFLVLVIDVGKGAAAVGIAIGLGVGEVAQFVAGATAVLGHAFPVFLRFRGGRGGATCIGVLCVLMPWGLPIAFGIFCVILLITRFPTLSYSVSLITFPFIGWLIYERWELVVYSVGLLLIPLVRYIPRIKEMRDRAGNWGRFFRRRGLGDRF
ncbi:MAG: glycerol-3-phosphate acyltransferase [Dehalococcoidales bacterium]|nr:MAG: glycerol-3-phosphate acyltransferase [Dehalococcoidales bacterium]